MVLSANPASGQPGPWSVSLGRDQADVTNHEVPTTWTTDRLQVGHVRPEAGGWFVTLERQTRWDFEDMTIGARGYRRAGDRTYAAGFGVTPDADFVFGLAVDGDFSQRLFSTVVGTVGYRYLNFTSGDVHQLQPSITWYHRGGEVVARVVATRNVRRDETSPTAMLGLIQHLGSRVRLSGGVAWGDRIFDVASLQAGRAASNQQHATVRIQITVHDAIEVGGSLAQEDPAFTYRAWSAGYVRTF